jgi:hypothetical protein
LHAGDHADFPRAGWIVGEWRQRFAVDQRERALRGVFIAGDKFGGGNGGIVAAADLSARSVRRSGRGLPGIDDANFNFEFFSREFGRQQPVRNLRNRFHSIAKT